MSADQAGARLVSIPAMCSTGRAASDRSVVKMRQARDNQHLQRPSRAGGAVRSASGVAAHYPHTKRMDRRNWGYKRRTLASWAAERPPARSCSCCSPAAPASVAKPRRDATASGSGRRLRVRPANPRAASDGPSIATGLLLKKRRIIVRS